MVSDPVKFHQIVLKARDWEENVISLLTSAEPRSSTGRTGEHRDQTSAVGVAGKAHSPRANPKSHPSTPTKVRTSKSYPSTH